MEALAAAAPGAGAPPQAVGRAGRYGRGERVADLAAGDALAVADDPAVLRVRRDHRGVAVGAGERLAQVRHPHRFRLAGAGDGQAAFGEQLDDVGGDRHRGAQAGGPDAADAHVPLGGMRPDGVVLLPGGRTQSRVDGGDLLVEERRQDPPALLPQQREPFGGRAGVRLVVQVLGGRPEHDVPVDGRCDQHSLAAGVGHRQQDVAYEAAGEFVEDDELTAAGRDGEVGVAEEAVDLVGVQARRVDQVAGAQRAPAGGQRVRFPRSDRPHGAVEVQVDAGAHGLRRVGEGGRPGADEGLVRYVEGSQHAGAELRFTGSYFRGREDPGRAVAVAYRLVRESREGRELLLVPGHEQGPDRFDRDAAVRGVGGEPSLSVADEPGLQGAGYGVETGVQDGGVGLGGAVADVVGRVDQGGPQGEAGQFAGDGGAHDAGADHGHVVRVGAVGQRAVPGDGHAGPSSRADTAVRNRARRSAASPAPAFGS